MNVNPQTHRTDSRWPRWDTHAHVFAGPVLPGSHYTPADHTLAMWRATAEPRGIDRVVLVQPSVYGFDNSVMLNALRESGGVHRGVAVLDPGATDRQLEDMHAAGVRGARFNLVSPVGNDPSLIDRTVERIRPLGWHLHLFLRPAAYAWVRKRHKAWAINVVFDHLAGMRADIELSAGERADLQALATAGAWIKISGLYRMEMQAPFAECDTLLPRIGEWFAGQVLWGSDWPHTWFMEKPRGNATAYGELLAPVARAFPDESTRQSILAGAPGRLYA